MQHRVSKQISACVQALEANNRDRRQTSEGPTGMNLKICMCLDMDTNQLFCVLFLAIFTNGALSLIGASEAAGERHCTQL